MKILHILNEIKFSGAEVMLRIAAPIITKNGFDLHVLSTGDDIGEYANILGSAGYAVHHISFKKSPKYFIALYRLLLKEEFDVVHIHPERAFFWHALVAKIAGAKTIIRTVHSVFLFSGFLKLKRTLQRFVASQILGVKFIAIGSSVAEVEEKVFHNNTLLIPNWIEPKRFLPARHNDERNKLRAKFSISPSDMVVVSVGSCSEVKNHKAIIVAVAELQRSLKNITYLHVGDGPMLQEEIDFAGANGVSEIIRFLGQMKDVRQALIASDIFVMASKYEGLGVSSLEAMSCGLPVVNYDVYGLKDVVKNGKGGFLVEPNPTALAKSIKELAMNDDLRERMGAEARDSVLSNFNMQESLEKLIKLYRGEPVV